MPRSGCLGLVLIAVVLSLLSQLIASIFGSSDFTGGMEFIAGLCMLGAIAVFFAGDD